MEYIIDFILDLLLGSAIEASKNSKIPKYIRYPLIVIISLFFIAVIGFIFFVGILYLKENIPFGILIILIGLFMIIMSVLKFRKTYLTTTNKK